MCTESARPILRAETYPPTIWTIFGHMLRLPAGERRRVRTILRATRRIHPGFQPDNWTRKINENHTMVTGYHLSRDVGNQDIEPTLPYVLLAVANTATSSSQGHVRENDVHIYTPNANNAKHIVVAFPTRSLFCQDSALCPRQFYLGVASKPIGSDIPEDTQCHGRKRTKAQPRRAEQVLLPYNHTCSRELPGRMNRRDETIGDAHGLFFYPDCTRACTYNELRPKKRGSGEAIALQHQCTNPEHRLNPVAMSRMADTVVFARNFTHGTMVPHNDGRLRAQRQHMMTASAFYQAQDLPLTRQASTSDACRIRSIPHVPEELETRLPLEAPRLAVDDDPVATAETFKTALEEASEHWNDERYMRCPDCLGSGDQNRNRIVGSTVDGEFIAGIDGSVCPGLHGLQRYLQMTATNFAGTEQVPHTKGKGGFLWLQIKSGGKATSSGHGAHADFPFVREHTCSVVSNIHTWTQVLEPGQVLVPPPTVHGVGRPIGSTAARAAPNEQSVLKVSHPVARQQPERRELFSAIQAANRAH
jgi:hypothetical protein